MKTLFLIASMIETTLRVRMMATWGTYTTADTIQLTIVNLSLVPILILRSRDDVSFLSLPYAFLLLSLQLFNGPSIYLATGDFGGANYFYNMALGTLEIAAATVIPIRWIKTRLNALAALQLLVIAGFWSAMVIVSQLTLDTTFMRLDRNMKACGTSWSCWTGDKEKLESLTKEILGHFTIQLMAFATIMSHKCPKAAQIGTLRGLFEMISVWLLLVLISCGAAGEVPYLASPANINK